MTPRHRPEISLADLAIFARRPEVDLPARVAAALGRDWGRWVPSGRAGLDLALRALGVRRAIVPAFNCWAVMQALGESGVEPVFVDVGDDLNADREQTLAAIEAAGPDTALVLTHQFGIPVRDGAALVAAARRRGLAVIEDGAAAFGATGDLGPVGSVGDLSVLSFQFTKTVIAGEGGMVLGGDARRDAVDRLAADYRPLPAIASARLRVKLAALAILTRPGVYRLAYPVIAAKGTYNRRDAAPDASSFTRLPSPWMRGLAARTLDRAPAALAARRRIARIYLDALAGLPVGLVPGIAGDLAAPIRFPVLVERRSAMIAACARRGLDLGRSFAYTCAPPGFPAAERIAATIVNLPLSAALEERAEAVAEIFRGVVRSVL